LWSFLRNLHRYVIVFDSLVWMGVCRVLRLQPGHKFYLLGHLSTEVGWHHYDTIKVWCDFYYPLLILQKKVMERVLIRILGSSGQISDLVCDEVPLVSH